ncbi:heavy-metal-associated domain-containing protein [Sphingomonas sp. S2-65]|uniref:heavy-metal-associated domain-containing protein n=1 Tax=Sphingomonas sp. S2-65 TaxID=2903960 RepID=UPI001F395949|nr:heavy-metal-associated domain-containing protein [Sphingomonas sp. S2-65]UYY58993.1 heavy-metal-associated domain-containing protein [Sphingomonas sp. S2-65]
MQVSRFSATVGLVGALALAGVTGMGLAQGSGAGAGAVAVDASGSFEVSGVQVDVKGKDAESARQGGWRLAQRKGWEMLSQRLTGRKSMLPDGTLDALSAGIVVEREQIGPDRYIAKLGVLFDRARAGAILGVSTQVTRSPPMLLVPLEFSGGVGRVFERETAWVRAWNRFRSGGSTIDYVRLGGTGPDALLVNAGQTLRRGRNWWRTVLDQYGASDVLVAEVQLRREYPGGPVVGVFAANHGPDRKPITSFALRVDNADALDALLDAGIQRIDAAYQQALAGGLLRADALLATRPPRVKTEAEKQAEAEAAATAAAAATATSAIPTPLPTSVSTASYTLQIETPNVSALNASESAVRGVPGVRSAATTSLALGGVSVMRVSYDGSIAGLRAALEARGWQVQEGAGVLRIRRGGPAAAPTPQSAPGNSSAATGG